MGLANAAIALVIHDFESMSSLKDEQTRALRVFVMSPAKIYLKVLCSLFPNKFPMKPSHMILFNQPFDVPAFKWFTVKSVFTAGRASRLPLRGN